MSFVDGTESYSEIKNLWITITHLPSNNSVKFKGMVTKFSDSYESKWNSEEVYGRSDPLETFQNTARMISLGWTVPAASLTEAEDNLEKCAALARYMYPVYGKGTNALVAPPLLSIKFTNLVRQIDPNKALVGRTNGFSYTPNFDADGVYDLAGELFPKTVDIELEFRVFHTHELGWSESGKWRGGKDFPYFTKDTRKDRTLAAKKVEEAKKACDDAITAQDAAHVAMTTAEANAGMNGDIDPDVFAARAEVERQQEQTKKICAAAEALIKGGGNKK